VDFGENVDGLLYLLFKFFYNLLPFAITLVAIIARASALMVSTRREQLLEYSKGSATPIYQKACAQLPL